MYIEFKYVVLNLRVLIQLKVITRIINTMEFPTLYGKPSSGTKVKIWTIKIDTSDDGTAFMVREHGYIDHKQTTASKHDAKCIDEN